MLSAISAEPAGGLNLSVYGREFGGSNRGGSLYSCSGLRGLPVTREILSTPRKMTTPLLRETNAHLGSTAKLERLRPLLCAAGVGKSLERFGHGWKHQENGLDLSNLKHLHHSLIHSCEGHAASSFLAGRVCADQRSQTRRVKIRDAGEVENHRRGALHAD